jgi:hypothetical protein
VEQRAPSGEVKFGRGGRNHADENLAKKGELALGGIAQRRTKANSATKQAITKSDGWSGNGSTLYGEGNTNPRALENVGLIYPKKVPEGGKVTTFVGTRVSSKSSASSSLSSSSVSNEITSAMV